MSVKYIGKLPNLGCQALIANKFPSKGQGLRFDSGSASNIIFSGHNVLIVKWDNHIFLFTELKQVLHERKIFEIVL